jgi:hypothetical protein
MMGAVRKAATGLAVLLVLVLAGFLAYVLPQHRVVHIDGVEVKRVDGTAVGSGVAPVPPITSSDVYYLHTSNPSALMYLCIAMKTPALVFRGISNLIRPKCKGVLNC